jgi:hypothetical protein
MYLPSFAKIPAPKIAIPEEFELDIIFAVTNVGAMRIQVVATLLYAMSHVTAYFVPS